MIKQIKVPSKLINMLGNNEGFSNRKFYSTREQCDAAEGTYTAGSPMGVCDDSKHIGKGGGGRKGGMSYADASQPIAPVQRVVEFEQSHLSNPYVQVAILGLAAWGAWMLAKKYV